MRNAKVSTSALANTVEQRRGASQEVLHRTTAPPGATFRG